MKAISLHKNSVQPYVPVVVGILALLLFAYTAVRAHTLSFTIDEIHSVQNFLFIRFYPDHYTTETANFHWLNSWLMKVISMFAGTDPFAMRLPSLCGHILFLVFSAKMVMQFRTTAFVIAAFLLLNAHPYLLDFFSLARGYALSLGCMMMALWFTYKRMQGDHRLQTLLLIQLSLVLAVFASLTLFNFFVCTNAVLLVYILLGKRSERNRFAEVAITVATSLLLLAIILPHLVAMKEAGALFHGDTLFWNGSIKTLVIQLLYGAPYAGTNHFASSHLVIYALCITIVLSLFFVARKEGWKPFLLSFPAVLLLLFGGVILLHVLEYYLMHALYPRARTGLYLFPLFMLLLVFAAGSWTNTRAAAAAACALSLPVIFHLCYNVNTRYTFEWKNAGNAEEIYATLKTHVKQQHGNAAVIVSTNGVIGRSFAYYLSQDKEANIILQEHWDTLAMPAADYYVVEEMMKPFHQMPDSLEIYRDPWVNTSVYRHP